MTAHLDTNAKALQINLDPLPYGTFAEIGGGQEVSRWFFTVGGAAGTVAKSISAYDMAVSDSIYGPGPRYVSAERIRAMLDYEYKRIMERLAPARGGKSCFFVFADTVATRNYKGTNECHGWVGLRMQHEPGQPPSEIMLHVALNDKAAIEQQRVLGVLGVNLIFAAFYQRGSRAELLAALMDGLSMGNLEIDVVECSGPAFGDLADPVAVALDMLRVGLTHSVLFDEHGQPGQPSTVLRKRGMLVHRCSLKRDNPERDRMIDAASKLLISQYPNPDHPPLAILEVSISGILAEEAKAAAAAAGSAPAATSVGITPPVGIPDEPGVASDPMGRVKGLIASGCAVLVTDYSENFRVSQYLRRYSAEPVRFVLGVDALVLILKERFYHNIDGGLLEGLGRLLTPQTRLYVFAMPAELLRKRLAIYSVDSTFCNVPDKNPISLDDVQIAPPAGHLLTFMREGGWIESAACATCEHVA